MALAAPLVRGRCSGLQRGVIGCGLRFLRSGFGVGVAEQFLTRVFEKTHDSHA